MKFFKLLPLLILLISVNKINRAQDTLSFDRTYLPYPDTVLVFLPESYNSRDNFPLAILLNGWSGSYKQWNGIVNLKKLAEQYNFVITTPDGYYDSWYCNNTRRKNIQYEKFFTEDLLPALLRKYKIDRSKIFISGLSMGGHGAITLFLKYNDLFLSAGSTSGILDITKFPKNWGLISALGEYELNEDSWKSNSAFYIIDSLKNKNKEFIIDCGTEDFAYDVNEKFFHKCKDLKLKITFMARPGKHERKYWAESILYHFDFFTRLLGKNKNQN